MDNLIRVIYPACTIYSSTDEPPSLYSSLRQYLRVTRLQRTIHTTPRRPDDYTRETPNKPRLPHSKDFGENPSWYLGWWPELDSMDRQLNSREKASTYLFYPRIPCLLPVSERTLRSLMVPFLHHCFSKHNRCPSTWLGIYPKHRAIITTGSECSNIRLGYYHRPGLR
jgi:hypothetical protein